MNATELAERKAKMEAKLLRKPRECTGCNDPATQWLEDIGPVCDQCAQVPEEVQSVCIDRNVALVAKVRAFTEHVRATERLRGGRS